MAEVIRGLVISGGGAWGAHGAGTIAALNKEYDVVAGISTGALMSPLVILNEFGILQDAYTSVTDKDIFDLKWYRPKPVNKKGGMNFAAIMYALIFKKHSLATAKAMRVLIDKFITEEQFERIRESKKDVIVGVQNLREKPSTIHYFNALDCEFEDFKDWMWGSALAPFYCNLMDKEWTDEDGNKHMGQWTDGGVTELLALDEVFIKLMKKAKSGEAKEIDVIVHRPIPVPDYDQPKIDTLIKNVGGVIDAMRHDIEFEYLKEKARYFATKRKTTVNIYFLPEKLSSNAMKFKKDEMTSWWNDAYATVGDESKVLRFEPKS